MVSYTVTEDVDILVSVVLSFIIMERKHKKVKVAKTVRLNANTALRRDNAVYIVVFSSNLNISEYYLEFFLRL